MMVLAAGLVVTSSLTSVNAADAGKSTLDRLSKPLEDAAVEVTTTVAKGFQYEGGNKLGDVEIDISNKIKTLVSTLGFVRIGNVTITKTEIPGKVKITVNNDLGTVVNTGGRVEVGNADIYDSKAKSLNVEIKNAIKTLVLTAGYVRIGNFVMYGTQAGDVKVKINNDLGTVVGTGIGIEIGNVILGGR